MKLLILTQKIDINDDVLGFFHGWVAEFAKHCEQVTVICLYRGEYDLPANVKVLSLGKEASKCKIKYLYLFYKYIWQERKNYDSVFVHMNQVYVVLGGLFWKAWGKRVSLWYTHRQSSCSLWIAEKLVDNIFTVSREGFSLVSEKVKIMGHGINTDIFKPLESRKENDFFKILTVGRISPIKDIKTLVRAISELKNKNCELEIVGGANGQEKYFQEVKDLIKELKIEDKVNFIGPIPNREVMKYYQTADLFVNMAPTGGLDKAILEAMACEVPVIVCNETMKNYLEDKLIFRHGDYKALSEKIKNVMALGSEERENLGEGLRRVVEEKHNLSNLILKILNAKTSR